MEKKVMELCDAAKRAAVAAVWKEGVVEEARCIDALDQIKNSSITYQLLVSTQVLIINYHSICKIRSKHRHFITCGLRLQPCFNYDYVRNCS